MSRTATPAQRAVVERCGVTLEQLLQSERGSSDIVRARHLAFHIERQVFGRSFPEIGRLYGRNHTTIMAACNHVTDRIKHGDAWFLEHESDAAVLALEEARRDKEEPGRHLTSVPMSAELRGMCCPTCGAPVITEMRRQIEELRQRMSRMERRDGE